MPRKPRRRRLGRLAFRKTFRRANRRRKRSSLEVTVEGWLTEDGITFRRQYAIGRCHTDLFFPPDRVVEINGCYWHGCSTCFPGPQVRHRMRRARDQRRYKFFRREGMKILVLWEHDIKKDPKKVRRRLKRVLKGIQKEEEDA